MALLLTEADVTRLLPISVALEAVEEVFHWQEDVLVAVRLVARARAEGVGQEIPI